MNEAKSQTAEAKGSEKKGERDLWAGLWSLDGAQKVLGAACGAVLIGVLFDRDLAWSAVFGTWHGAMAFAGAVGGLALIVLRALHVRVLPKAHEARAMMILALLPAVPGSHSGACCSSARSTMSACHNDPGGAASANKRAA